MSTARVSVRALKALTSTSKTFTRNLSITGSSPFSSVITSDKPAGRSHAPRLPASAKISVPETDNTGKPVRHFNTSRSLKAIKDSSTIDFVYLPEFDTQTTSTEFRVPILPFNQASQATRAQLTEAETPVFMPTIISTAAADDTHIYAPSAMMDSEHTGFQDMANQVVQKIEKSAQAGESMTRQILSDMWEDIVGGRKQGGHART